MYRKEMTASRYPAAGIWSFHVRLIVVWMTLLALFLAFFLSFGLDLPFMLDKFPALAGITLSRAGFIQGAVLTLYVCCFSIVASVGLGMLSALGRLSNSAVLYGVSTFYTSFFRGTPLLVQIFLIYLGIPQIGPVPAAIPSGIIALSLNYGAYLSEVFRAGLAAVPAGQREAGLALGLHPWQLMLKVVMPQAIRIAIPPTGSQFIAMLKDSSLISVMGVTELMFVAQSYGRASYRYVEMLTSAALIYWFLSILLELLQARLENHFGKGYRR